MNRKDYPVQIGDKTYLLRYNYDAFTFLEDLTGKSFGEVIQIGSMTTNKQLLFAGLRKNHSDISLESVGDLFDESDDIGQLMNTVRDAVASYFSKTVTNVTPKKKNQPIASTSQTAE